MSERGCSCSQLEEALKQLEASLAREETDKREYGKALEKARDQLDGTRIHVEKELKHREDLIHKQDEANRDLMQKLNRECQSHNTSLILLNTLKDEVALWTKMFQEGYLVPKTDEEEPASVYLGQVLGLLIKEREKALEKTNT